MFVLCNTQSCLCNSMHISVRTPVQCWFWVVKMKYWNVPTILVWYSSIPTSSYGSLQAKPTAWLASQKIVYWFAKLTSRVCHWTLTFSAAAPNNCYFLMQPQCWGRYRAKQCYVVGASSVYISGVSLGVRQAHSSRWISHHFSVFSPGR